MEKTVTILADKGIHLHPATLLSRFASKHKDLNIRFVKGSRETAATSVMGILSLELSRGSTVRIVLEREDEKVVKHIQDILEGTVVK